MSSGVVDASPTDVVNEPDSDVLVEDSGEESPVYEEEKVDVSDQSDVIIPDSDDDKGPVDHDLHVPVRGPSTRLRKKHGLMNFTFPDCPRLERGIVSALSMLCSDHPNVKRMSRWRRLCVAGYEHQSDLSDALEKIDALNSRVCIVSSFDAEASNDDIDAALVASFDPDVHSPFSYFDVEIVFVMRPLTKDSDSSGSRVEYEEDCPVMFRIVPSKAFFPL